MPTITMEIEELNKLVGRELSVEEIASFIERLKGEVEKIEGGEITAEVTSDRPDLFSVEGIARAIRLLLGLQPSSFIISEGSIEVLVKESVLQVRPAIACAAVRGASLSESAVAQIMQLQEKLHHTYGLRRKEASIGVYDLDKVTPPIYYEALPPEEIVFTPLNCKEEMTGREILEKTEAGRLYGYLLKEAERYPVLRDSKGVVLSMPPIINSEDTRVTEDSRNLFIDVTGFNQLRLNDIIKVLATSIAERGRTLEVVRIHRLGGEMLSTPSMERQRMLLDLSYVEEVLGTPIDLAIAEQSLVKMGHKVSRVGEGRLLVEVAPYRVDILHPVDLVEDVAIGMGLEQLPLESPPIFMVGRLHWKEQIARRVRDLMIGLGFQEVVTYILGSREIVELSKEPYVEIANPVSSEYIALRNSLVPKLVMYLAHNQHVEYPQKIFEVGDCVEVHNGVPKTTFSVAAAIADYSVGFEDIQAVAHALLANLGLTPQYSSAKHPCFIEGRCADVLCSTCGEKLGVMGEVRPEILESMELLMPVAAMELKLEKVKKCLDKHKLKTS